MTSAPLKTFVKPCMIFIPLAAGTFFQQASSLAPAIRYFLFVMLFLSSLKTEVKEFSLRKQHFAIVFLNLAIGLGAYFFLSFLGVNEAVAEGALLCGLAPTANAAPVIMGFLGGNQGFVVTALLLTNVFSSLALLFVIPCVSDSFALNFFVKVVFDLAFVMVLPVVLAFAVKKFFPEIKNHAKKLNFVNFCIWAFILFIASAVASSFVSAAGRSGTASIVMMAGLSFAVCALNFFLGYLIPSRALHRECSQALGQKNTMLMVYVALRYADPLAVLGPVFYVFFHNSWNAVQIFRCERKNESGKK